MNAITKTCLAIALLSFLISAGCETSTETSSKSLPEESTRAHADSENVTVSLCLSKLMHRLQSLQSEHSFDEDRSDRLFANVELDGLTEEREQSLRTLVLETIEFWEQGAKEPHPVRVDPEVEKQLFETLRRKEFRVDFQIKESDVELIITYLENHPPLDPRILSLKFIDDKTIKIKTGEVRGPLNGGGSYYVARREDGRWIVRRTGSSWVS